MRGRQGAHCRYGIRRYGAQRRHDARSRDFGHTQMGLAAMIDAAEIAYNHFHNRMGRALPLTDRLIREKIRPSGTGTHMAWESLTHGELGALRADAMRPPARRASARGALLIVLGTGLVWMRDGRIYGLDGTRLPIAGLNRPYQAGSR